jgi:pilus assembly protein Flp/PilA
VFAKEKPMRIALNTIRQRRDDGASAVEYGLLVALVAVVIATVVVALGLTLRGKFQEACNAVNNQDKATTALEAPATDPCPTN